MPPFNAMVTKILKWSRIQDSCRITPKIESLVVYTMPDIPSKFQRRYFLGGGKKRNRVHGPRTRAVNTVREHG